MGLRPPGCYACERCGDPVTTRCKYGRAILCLECKLADQAQVNREMAARQGPAWDIWLDSMERFIKHERDRLIRGGLAGAPGPPDASGPGIPGVHRSVIQRTRQGELYRRDLADMCQRAAYTFADVTDQGRIPGILRIRNVMQCGQSRAQVIRAYLAEIAGSR